MRQPADREQLRPHPPTPGPCGGGCGVTDRRSPREAGVRHGRRASRPLLAALLAVAATPSAGAEPNYDEAAVRTYTLPDVLAGPAGVPAITAESWRTASRPYQVELLEKSVYGRRLPAVPVTVVGDVERAGVTLAGDRTATRLQARLRLGAAADANVIDVLVYLPKGGQPVPVFLGLNFFGNHAEHPDPGIWLSRSWMRENPEARIVDHRATEASRGRGAQRFPVEQMLARGYGMATAYYGDIFPDRADGRPDSVLGSLGRPTSGGLGDDEPGAIAAWAWGLSRILDWLVTLPEIDAGKVAVFGHSRLGKTALWAGACDERFALVVANESGCGGAALSRRNYGETVAAITKAFPHWFCPAFATFADREPALPTDQHALLALVAPRPLYVASAIEDTWADPRGEFLAAVAAEPAWKLHGLTGLGTTTWPPVDTPVGRTVGYHVRSGRHDLIDYDWQRFADFADRTLRRREPPPADGHPAFHPLQTKLPVKPPPGAIVLFGDGTTPAKFTGMAGGPLDWEVRDGSLVVRSRQTRANHAVSTVTFRDADIHAEFVVPAEAHGNSGLYLHGLYELQILDSSAIEPPTDAHAGGLYRFARPACNAALPPGQWQVYDVRFIAPRRDPQGRITAPGRVTAWLNGRLVQNGLEFTEPRSPYTPYQHGVTDHLRAVERTLQETGRGPLVLQEHDSPVRYRNVWIVPFEGR